MGESVMDQMEEAYWECVLGMLPAIKVSRKLRRDYLNELSNKKDPQLNKKGWIFPRYRDIGIVPENSSFWESFIGKLAENKGDLLRKGVLKDITE